jgi:hypothetical protein
MEGHGVHLPGTLPSILVTACAEATTFTAIMTDCHHPLDPAATLPGLLGCLRHFSREFISAGREREAFVDASDFNGDGRGDLLWRDSITGDVHGWLMSGLSRSASGFIRNASKEWHNVP